MAKDSLAAEQSVGGSPASLCYAGDPVQFGRYMTEAQEVHFRETFPKACCAVCRFWCQHEDPVFCEEVSTVLRKPVPQYRGDCKRHAPIIPTPVPDDVEPAMAYWPGTRHDNWCGDFEAA